MNTAAILDSADGARFIADVTRITGLPPAKARRAAESLLPALIKGIARTSISRSGLADLLRSLGTAEQVAPEIAGQTALGQWLGGARQVDGVTQRAMQETGISGAILKQVLPMAAAFLMGWLYRNSGDALGSVLGNVLSGGRGDVMPNERTGGGLSLPQMPGSGGSRRTRSAGGGPLSMPDLDRIRTNRGSRPVTDNPFPDLGDIVGGRGGGATAGSIRDILGGLLGFRTGGWLGWIIRFLVLRYGWRILGFLVRRIFLRA